MSTDSVGLVLELVTDTARLANQSGDGLSETAASAMIEIIGQVRTRSCLPFTNSRIDHRKGETCIPHGQGRKGCGLVRLIIV